MDNLLAAWAPRILSVLRIYAGLLLFAHGTAKILGFPAVPSFASIQINSLVGASGLIELIGGALFTVGLFTRPVAFILSGLAAVAYFMVSAPRGFHPILNNGELASLFSFVLIYFVFSGPGPWSLDRMMKLNDHPTDAESDSPHAKSSHARGIGLTGRKRTSSDHTA